ncbi:MAG: PorT family protein [Chitinophagales bacterium]|nr:PorT family protein [Chitinophagales bacterium]
MNKRIFLFLLTIFIGVYSPSAKAQVLISLLLGDKLNSDWLEFGLEGGGCLLNMTNTPGSEMMLNWQLGFYFDFKVNTKLFISTGVLVKSKMGTEGLTPYSLDNANLDTVFTGGSVQRKINYFNVPGTVKYRFIDYLHAEGGIQLGLRYTGFDEFKQEIDGDDLEYSNDVKDNFTRLDAGGLVGLGYKLKQGKGMGLNARYYFGLVDVNKVEAGSQHNTAFYFSASIPIGKGKAEKKAAEKADELNKQN